MPKFRKRPIVIEAFQHLTPDGIQVYPEWFIQAVLQGVVHVKDGETYIETLEGTHRASNGDWIIQGVNDEIYPCKPDIFAATYEEA